MTLDLSKIENKEKGWALMGTVDGDVGGGWVSLHRGDTQVTLDGDFTLEELRQIVKYVEDHGRSNDV